MAVFISARYININGLIQSGIDQWTLTLANNRRFRFGFMFGVDLTAAIGAYNNSRRAPACDRPASAPSCNGNAGRSNSTSPMRMPIARAAIAR